MKGIEPIMRDCELQHILKYNYVFTKDGYVIITEKLWGELMKSEENQKLVNELKQK